MSTNAGWCSTFSAPQVVVRSKSRYPAREILPWIKEIVALSESGSDIVTVEGIEKVRSQDIGQRKCLGPATQNNRKRLSLSSQHKQGLSL